MNMDRMQLLCDIGELNHLFRESISVENFMQRTVEMVAEHLKADVCSVYIYDDDEEEIKLEATKGLKQPAAAHVKMKIGEGLVGKALKELRPICVRDASSHPDYKYFPGIDEEQYESFLAVPITRGILRIGVLVLQRKSKFEFVEEDITACRAVASQLANIIENARFLMAMHHPKEERKFQGIPDSIRFIRGKAASEGFAYAEAMVIDKERTFANLLQTHFEHQYTMSDFDRALANTQKQLGMLQKEVEERLSDAASLIFSSHLLILKDHEFVGAMRKLIEEGENPPEAVLKIAGEYISIFSTSKNDYVREKIQDVEDLTVRLISNLLKETESVGEYSEKVLIARDLFPSDLLRISSEQAAGIILVSGGVTSHLSILSRSLKIPMVIANKPALMNLPAGTKVMIDGHTGNVCTEPTQEAVEKITKRNENLLKIAAERPAVEPQTHTADGARVYLLANINLISDINTACESGCEGIGLYRTEFPFIIRNDFPTEQEQYITYRKLVEMMKGRPVSFRTLDVGGDKMLSYYESAYEQNPSMGMRSIRFSLQNKEVFAKQIQAILRAGSDADLRIMFPMISSIEEFREGQEVVEQCKQELRKRGVEHNSEPKIGLMVEVPSVIPMMDIFAREADFFSIGTNDLIQFMLGVDRTNENVESFYLPHHPAVLRAMKQVIDTANKQKKEVSVCGDMAGSAEFIPFFLGIGLRRFSMDPAMIPAVQLKISQTRIKDAKKTAGKVLAEVSIKKIAEILDIKEPQDEMA